jgi:Kef-type K+ transport system membrane component KefB
MKWLGLSAALGAFIAGVVLADSEYRHQLERDIEPFKALLLGLFFISVGMSLSFTTLAERPALIAGLVLGLLAIKFIVLYAIGTLFKMVASSRVLFGAFSNSL